MGAIRSVPLFDPAAEPATWNERMLPGEFAVHESSSTSTLPVCTVFSSFAEAEAFASERVQQQNTLRTRIYDHQGFIGAPLREFRGAQFKGERNFSPRVRRWLGAAFLVVGSAMVLADWSTDFRLTWPAVVGSRLLIPGALLFATEALIFLQARYGARFAAHATSRRNTKAES